MMSTNDWYDDMYTTYKTETVAAFSAIGAHAFLMLTNTLYYILYQRKIKQKKKIDFRMSSFVRHGLFSDFDLDGFEVSELDL